MSCIEVKNVYKSYKSHGEIFNVLDGINLSVGYGEIYSLIGASGCGKTTLFTCLMGMQNIENGEMRIFNQKVSYNKLSKNFHAIGYMPQQIALIQELTIEETLLYFGNLLMMNSIDLNLRILDVVKLLDLSNKNSQIKNLSGGQRRRVSLAVAILHKPKLLLLDEPTVGLDYLLRDKIWNFLRESTSKFKITVVITTHYIDEAKNSDRCGFMRNGKIIAQNTPANILAQLECETLEEAFYNLSLVDENGTKMINFVESKVDEFECTDNENEDIEVEVLERKNTKVVKTLLRKEFHRIKRQPIEIFFLLFAPIITINLSIYALGNIQNNIQIGIVNNEIKVEQNCNKLLINCSRLLISCTFLQDLNEKIIKTSYNSIDSAFKDMKSGILNGIIEIPQNFSQSIYNENLSFDKIDVYLDYLIYVQDLFVKTKVYEALKSSTKKLAENCTDKVIQQELMNFDFLYQKMDFNFRNTFGVIGSFLLSIFMLLNIWIIHI